MSFLSSARRLVRGMLLGAVFGGVAGLAFFLLVWLIIGASEYATTPAPLAWLWFTGAGVVFGIGIAAVATIVRMMEPLEEFEDDDLEDSTDAPREAAPLETSSDGSLIVTQQEGAVLLVRVDDPKLLDPQQIESFFAETQAAWEQSEARHLVLDFAGVQFVAPSLLAKLTQLAEGVEAHGGMFKLAQVRPEVYDSFCRMELEQVFDFYDTTEQAIAACKAA